jgi:hypothetical protein
MMKRYLVEIGHWDYVRVKDSIYMTPSFKGEERAGKLEERQSWAEASLATKTQMKAVQVYSKVKSFMLRLLPMYMSHR